MHSARPQDPSVDVSRISATPHDASVLTDRAPPRQWSLDHFDVGRKLGEGRFGKVYLARERRSKCAVVLKCIAKEMIVLNSLEYQIQREVQLQAYCGQHCPHVLRLLAYFWDADRVILVMDFAEGGDLKQWLERRRAAAAPVTEVEAATIVRQLAAALAFIHARHIVHRDIKPENVLLRNGRVKLSDFSWAVQCDPHSRKHARRYTMCGTLDYLAPEQVRQQGYGVAADMWSLGVLTYELLCGALPFERDNVRDTYASIVAARVSFPSQPHLSEAVKHFVTSLLCGPEAMRLTAAEALQHPFLAADAPRGDAWLPAVSHVAPGAADFAWRLPSIHTAPSAASLTMDTMSVSSLTMTNSHTYAAGGGGESTAGPLMLRESETSVSHASHSRFPTSSLGSIHEVPPSATAMEDTADKRAGHSSRCLSGFREDTTLSLSSHGPSRSRYRSQPSMEERSLSSALHGHSDGWAVDAARGEFHVVPAKLEQLAVPADVSIDETDCSAASPLPRGIELVRTGSYPVGTAGAKARLTDRVGRAALVAHVDAAACEQLVVQPTAPVPRGSASDPVEIDGAQLVVDCALRLDFGQ